MSIALDQNNSSELSLSNRQKQFLKGLAHHMSPIVQIGKDGLSPGIVALIKKELLQHELIKIKIADNSGLEKKDTAAQVAQLSASTMVQLIGKTIVLFKANPKRPKDKQIKLPAR